MPTGLLPTAAPDGVVVPTEPQAVVEAFLAALADLDVQGSAALLDEDVCYVNVGLPPVRGRAKVARFLGGLDRPGAGFEVYLHAISTDGETVLTERTDVITLGRFRSQLWVCGRFDVVDGQITLWRDAFDYVDIIGSVFRGLAGIVLPGLRPKAPTSLADAPGR